MSSDFIFFFFNDTATTEIYTLSLHDALPILVLTARRRFRSQLVIRVRSPANDGLRLRHAARVGPPRGQRRETISAEYGSGGAATPRVVAAAQLADRVPTPAVGFPAAVSPQV